MTIEHYVQETGYARKGHHDYVPGYQPELTEEEGRSVGRIAITEPTASQPQPEAQAADTTDEE